MAFILSIKGAQRTANPGESLDARNQKIVNVAAPTNSNDVSTKVYADNPCVYKVLSKFFGKILHKKLLKQAEHFGTKPKKIYKFIAKSSGSLFGIAAGYEIYNAFSVFDDNFQGDEYVAKAWDASIEAVEIYNSTKNDKEAKRKLGDAYFFLGYAAYHKIVPYKSDAKKFVFDKIIKRSNDLSDMAIRFFNESINLQEGNAFSYYFRGDTYYAMSIYKNAQQDFMISELMFIKENKKDWAKEANLRIKQIDAVLSGGV